MSWIRSYGKESNCVIFLDKQVIFCRASGSFQVGQAMLREEVRMSWGIDPCIPDVVEPCSHGFIRLVAHGRVNVP